MITTISVDERNWKRLNALREPGQSMNDIISLILNYFEEEKQKNNDDFLSDEFCSDSILHEDRKGGD